MAGFRLSHFSAAWRQEFEQAKSMLLWASEGWISEILHVGSTALEGSLAVPTIDILAGVTDLSGLNDAARLIEGLNYERQPAPSWTDDELVASLVRYKDGHATHSVLLAKIEGQLFKRCVAIQQRLARDFLVYEAFDNLKKEHFSIGSSLDDYVNSKSAFFERLMSVE
jgi:GrpB-like predicted nucleotidyltransferase (UPF0157 family)